MAGEYVSLSLRMHLPQPQLQVARRCPQRRRREASLRGSYQVQRVQPVPPLSSSVYSV